MASRTREWAKRRRFTPIPVNSNPTAMISSSRSSRSVASCRHRINRFRSTSTPIAAAQPSTSTALAEICRSFGRSRCSMPRGSSDSHSVRARTCPSRPRASSERRSSSCKPVSGHRSRHPRRRTRSWARACCGASTMSSSRQATTMAIGSEASARPTYSSRPRDSVSAAWKSSRKIASGRVRATRVGDRRFSATRLCWSIGIGGIAMTP